MRRKIFLSTLLAFVVFAVTAGAAANMTAIRAQLNHAIKFVVNGKPWTPPATPISYNGTTYLPVRAVGEAVGAKISWNGSTQTVTINSSVGAGGPTESYDVILEFPADRFPQTAAHIASAILAGESAVCTIDREGADERREQSLAGIPTKEGYDRDEWPMAMCAEGGAGADVAYVESSDNRGAGSWVGNALEKYPDGTRVKFVVTFGDLDADEQRNTPAEGKNSGGNVEYASCAAAKAAGAAPLRKGDPGYSPRLDRDGDGIACES